jgi:Acyl-CoA carboxylase epsilon subunit
MTAPLFHVKRGAPTAEELAALTAVLAAKASTAARRRAGPPPWGAPGAAHRHPLPPPGPAAWKQAIAGNRATGGLWTAAGAPRPGPLGSPSGGPNAGRLGSGVPGVAGVGDA